MSTVPVFTLDPSVPPLTVNLTGFVGGDNVPFPVTVFGLQAGDTVVQMAATFKVAATDADNAASTVQVMIAPSADGGLTGITSVPLSPNARKGLFPITSAQASLLAACTVYDVRVWVQRNGVTYDRVVQRGTIAATAPVTAATSPVATVILSPNTAQSITSGSQLQLTATPKDSAGNVVSYPATWSSSNKPAATVDGSGLVTGAGNGSATITVTIGGISASITVTSSVNYAQQLTAQPGLFGLWAFDEGSGVWAYNGAGPKTTSANLLPGPERMFSSAQGNDTPWLQTACTVTDDYAPNRYGMPGAASRFQAAANAGGYLRQVYANLAAGTYTLSIDVASNTGLAQTIRMSPDNGGTISGNLAVPASGWTRLAFTFTWGGGTANLIPVWQDAAGDALDLLIYGAQLNTGSSAAAYVPPAFDMEFSYSAVQGAGRPAWFAGGGLNMQGSTMVMASSDGNALLSTCSVYVLARWSGAQVNTQFAPLLNEHFSANRLWLDAVGQANGTYSQRLRFQFSNTIIDAYTLKPQDGAYHVFAGVYDGTNLTVYLDDVPMKSVAAAGLTPVAIRQLLLGSVNAVGFWPGDIQYAALYRAGHTAAQVKNVGNALRAIVAARGITMQPLQKLVVWEGDSISDVSAGTGYFPNLAMVGSTKGAQGYDSAVSGSTIADVNNRAAAVDALYDATRAKNVLHVLCGRNDSGIMGASYWTNSLKPYIAARRAVGWKVVVATLLPSTLAGWDANRDACNAAIRADPTAYDGLADFAANATMGADGAASNATYYQDGTHPTIAGAQILAPIAQAAVDALL